jgi:hypothetical protein
MNILCNFDLGGHVSCDSIMGWHFVTICGHSLLTSPFTTLQTEQGTIRVTLIGTIRVTVVGTFFTTSF